MDTETVKKDKVLIVDDNAVNLDLLFEYLDKNGFEVFVAEDGASAIEQFQYAKPDIVLLDVMMPEMDGFETCRRLKENPDTIDIPVIFMTALSDTKSKIKGFEVGAVDFVTKPFQYEELLVRVTTHLTLRSLQKELEARNTYLEQEIARRKRIEAKLRIYASKLEQSNRELEEFAYVASHDLQEPLRKVQTFGDRLETKYGEQLGDHGRDYLARMRGATSRMQALIDGLLTYAQVTTKAQPFEQVDLAQLMQEVLSDLELYLQQACGEVRIGDLPTIEADPTQMRQLFQNLVSNALKFHRKNVPPLVRIKARFLRGRRLSSAASGPAIKLCQIAVADNGIGFDEKNLDRIFQMFQRLRGRSEYKGTGIGLATCRKIAKRHGGSITARSAPGQGATFLVTLPVIQMTTGDEEV